MLLHHLNILNDMTWHDAIYTFKYKEIKFKW